MIKNNLFRSIFGLLILIVSSLSCAQFQKPLEAQFPSETQSKEKTRISPTQSESTQPSPNAPGWSQIGSIELNRNTGEGLFSDVTSLGFAPDGTLYAGGYFLKDHAEMKNATANIAKWDGHSWSLFGTGVAGAVSSFVIDSDGTIYSIIHEETDYNSGNIKMGIAKWDGNNWSKLVTGVDAYFSCLILDPNGILYVGGQFTEIGGVKAVNIAKWDGNNWSAVGDSLSEYDEINEMVMAPNGILYVLFTNQDIDETTNLAKWADNKWTPIQIGINVHFSEMAIDPNGILCASGISSKDDVRKRFIAKLDGSVLSFIDIEFDTPYSIIGFSPNGTLFVTSIQTPAPNESNTSHLATVFSWDGTNWSTLVGGFAPDTQLAFSPVENALYAAGGFNHTSGVFKLELKIP